MKETATDNRDYRHSLQDHQQAIASLALAKAVSKLATNPNLEAGTLSVHAVEVAEALVAGMAVIQGAQASDSSR